jgi:hypothetical protein
MMQEGIRVKVDLIVGLPGDTVVSVRKGLHYLHDNGLCSDIQVFNLAVLPGTAFREQAAELGLIHQPRPPYYVLKTPSLDRTDLFGLMQEAQELFDIEFDSQPPPVLHFPESTIERCWTVDLDGLIGCVPAPQRRAQAFTLWLRSPRFGRQVGKATSLIRDVLVANPFTTLQVVLEPSGDLSAEVVREEISPSVLGALLAECQANPTYLDKFYALQPGRQNGAKRLVLLLPFGLRERLDPDWIEDIGELATIVWRGPTEDVVEEEMELCRSDISV